MFRTVYLVMCYLAVFAGVGAAAYTGFTAV